MGRFDPMPRANNYAVWYPASPTPQYDGKFNLFRFPKDQSFGEIARAEPFLLIVASPGKPPGFKRGQKALERSFSIACPLLSAGRR